MEVVGGEQERLLELRLIYRSRDLERLESVIGNQLIYFLGQILLVVYQQLFSFSSL